MPARSTKQEFVIKSRIVHGDKYGYDEFVYVNSKTKSFIRCPKHGLFSMDANAHVCGKQGCPYCAKEEKTGRPRSLVYGVGYNDLARGASMSNVAKVWRGMLYRCYYSCFKDKYPTYKDCSVCDEWLTLSEFKKWFDENYVEGYALDKDILVKGNKVYGPDTCCFVPQEINSLIVAPTKRSSVGRGVTFAYGKYRVLMNKKGKLVHLGVYDSKEKAFAIYKTAKESYVKELATDYYGNNKITQKVYNALLNYAVENN